MNFPEKYKNTVCCIKCRKLGVEYTGKTKFRYCKTCKSHVYIYNEIPVQKDPKSAKTLFSITVIFVFFFLASQNSPPSVTFFMTIATGLLFTWAFKNEKKRIRKIEAIMKEHLENNFILSEEDENIVDKEIKESIDFENWKSEYLKGDPVRKFFSDEQIAETFANQASKD